ncbi:MAG: V-type ATP synthase subunit F [Thermovenabulum sp.]|uniref:V-type ATP synthase subunit F n=1 Tax=Thermovenabulum sp. TaxID=3100335 RepID=UPI003C7A7FE0
MRMFVISDSSDTITGFRLAGIEGKYIEESQEVLKEIDKLKNDEDIGIILITESLAQNIKNELSAMKLSKDFPIILEVPDRHGSIRPKDFLTRYIKEAIGVKI